MNSSFNDEKREFVRVEISFTVIVETDIEEHACFEGKLCNIGAQGLMVKLPVRLSPGDTVRIFGEDAGENPPLIGWVKWIDSSAAEENYTGIELDERYAEQNDVIMETFTQRVIDEIENSRNN